jgi:hypothetical protein
MGISQSLFGQPLTEADKHHIDIVLKDLSIKETSKTCSKDCVFRMGGKCTEYGKKAPVVGKECYETIGFRER